MANQVAVGQAAPDFELADVQGNTVCPSSYRGSKRALLVFTRGFLRPYCRAHLAQLREEYAKFVERDAEILVIGPEGPRRFKQVWEKQIEEALARFVPLPEEFTGQFYHISIRPCRMIPNCRSPWPTPAPCWS